jgi:hypothetical protein
MLPDFIAGALLNIQHQVSSIQYLSRKSDGLAPLVLCPAPFALSRESTALCLLPWVYAHCLAPLSDLFDDACGDQGQQDFVMSDQIDTLAAFGRGAVDHISQGAIVFDEIQVDRGKIT